MNRYLQTQRRETMEPDAKDVEGFNAFMTSYINGLAAREAP